MLVINTFVSVIGEYHATYIRAFWLSTTVEDLDSKDGDKDGETINDVTTHLQVIEWLKRTFAAPHHDLTLHIKKSLQKSSITFDDTYANDVFSVSWRCRHATIAWRHQYALVVGSCCESPGDGWWQQQAGGTHPALRAPPHSDRARLQHSSHSVPALARRSLDTNHLRYERTPSVCSFV